MNSFEGGTSNGQQETTTVVSTSCGAVEDCITDINNSVEYTCNVSADKSYTSFKWLLNNYTVLEEYYADNFMSPYFYIANTKKQCKLIFYSDANDVYVFLRYPRDIQCVSSHFRVSIVNNDGDEIISSGTSINSTASEETGYGDYRVKLITSSEIFNKKGCLTNDTLNLLCEIRIINSVNVSAPNLSYVHCDNFNKNVLSKFNNYYNTAAFSDVDLCVKNKKFHAHKIVLAAASPVFEAMFQADMLEQKNNSVAINDIDSDIFEAFLKYLYVGTVQNLDNLASDLLIVAGKYQVDVLIDLCEQFLIGTLSLSNAIEYLLIAHDHHFEKLLSKSLQFVRPNIRNLTETSEFKDLCRYSDLLARILKK